MADTTRFDYRYPLTKLTSSDDYLKITVLDYKPPGIVPTGGFALPTAGEVGGYNIKQEKGTIILPIPDNIKDNNNAQWGPSEVNLISALGFGAAATLLGDNGIENLTKKIAGGIETAIKASQTGTTQKAIAGTAIAKSVSILLNNQDRTRDVVGRVAGVAVNSNIELIFSGVKLREGFTFAFDITPRSQKEAQQVKEIIRAFKKHSAAKKQFAADLFLKAPEVFKLEYMSGGKRHPYLNRFKICALQSMSVDYTGINNTYATYADGAPVNMVLSLGFQELTPIYAEDYDEGIGTEGTGY